MELRFLTPAEVAALVDGEVPTDLVRHPEYPMSGSLDAARMYLERSAVSGDPAPWGIALVLSDDRSVIGDAGFHGGPAAEGPPEVEIGYTIVPARRGAGAGKAVVAALVELALAHGAEMVRAETTTENLPSQAVLRANGFLARGPNAAGDLVFELAPEPT